MLKFLIRKVAGEPKIETQRDKVMRALRDVNEVLAGLDPKPRITLDPASGQISLDLPEQMPDEALALPAPDTAETASTAAAAPAPGDAHATEKAAA